MKVLVAKSKQESAKAIRFIDGLLLDVERPPDVNDKHPLATSMGQLRLIKFALVETPFSHLETKVTELLKTWIEIEKFRLQIDDGEDGFLNPDPEAYSEGSGIYSLWSTVAGAKFPMAGHELENFHNLLNGCVHHKDTAERIQKFALLSTEVFDQLVKYSNEWMKKWGGL